MRTATPQPAAPFPEPVAELPLTVDGLADDDRVRLAGGQGSHMLGAVAEDPVGWHDDKQVVRLCSRLTWVMLTPGAIGVLIQGPIWLMGHRGVIETDLAVVLILVLRTGLGWVLRAGSWALMIWLLARNATPLEAPATD